MTVAPTIRFLDRTTPPHILTLTLIAGIAALNMSIFLPSLASMAEFFDTDYALVQLAVSGYLATTALLQLAIGPISDRFGRRAVTMGALIIFLIATVGAMLSTEIWSFLAFRMAQAVVVTGMVLSRAVVRDIFDASQSASMIGYVTMGMALVPMVGPMIGGALESTYGWQASFVFLTVAGLLVLALVWADQGETISGDGVSFAEQVRVWPELLTSPRFWGYVLCTGFTSGAFFAYLGGASFVAENVYGLSPFWTGFVLGAPAIGYATGNFLTGRYTTRVGLNRMILIGAVVTFLGIGLALALTLAGFGSAFVFFGLVTFMGLGNGLTMPNAMAGMLSVRPHLAGTASGLGGTIQIGAGAVLSALAGASLSETSGETPLQWIMFLTSVAAVISILLVMRREARLAGRL